MTDSHPATLILLYSSLLVFWLTPISAWWMLSGAPNRSARIWFLGTALYALVATIFIFIPLTSFWVRGPLSNALSLASLLAMYEALRRETSDDTPPVIIYSAIILGEQVILNIAYVADHYQTIGFAVHLLSLALFEVVLISTALRVRQIYQSRALMLIVCILALFAISNLVRTSYLPLQGRIPTLNDFTLVSNIALILNLVSVVFYCYGYWGFVIEKNNYLIKKVNSEASEARHNEETALEREESARLEGQLRTQTIQRIAEISRIAQSAALTGSIAHEINQPLAAMTLNLSETLRRFDQKISEEELRNRLLRFEKDSQNIISIVQRMKAIFRQDEPLVRKNNIDNVVRSAVKLMQQDFDSANITIKLKLATGFSFEFAAEEIESVIVNLLRNAVDVLKQKPSDRQIEISSFSQDKSVFVTVADNGPGIPDTLRATLFEIHETNKKQGLGLGLWLARYIMERNQGKIFLEDSSLGQTSFMIQLPRDPQRWVKP